MESFFSKFNSDIEKTISNFHKEQQDALCKFNSHIEKAVSNFLNEHKKLFAKNQEENELLKIKLKEYELNSMQTKLSHINEANGYGKTNHKTTCVEPKKRLFSNFCPSPNMLNDEILAHDTCDMFLNERNYIKESTEKFDQAGDELTTILETQFQFTENCRQKSLLDPFEIDTQISEEGDYISLPTNAIDSDETLLECDFDDDCDILVSDKQSQPPSVIDLDATRLEEDFNDIDENKENESQVEIERNANKSIKYVGSTIRKKADRQGLKGFDCIECKNYYGALEMTDSQIVNRIQQCSRHRAIYVPPSTPEGYWDIGRVTKEIPRDDEAKLKRRRAKKLQLPKREWIR